MVTNVTYRDWFNISVLIHFIFSAFTTRGTARGHFSYPEESHITITHSKPAPPLQDSHNNASHVIMSGGMTAASHTRNGRPDDLLHRYEANVKSSKTTEETISNVRPILSENVQKHKEKKEESSHIPDINKSANESPSFGFVNKDFQPPPPRQGRGNGLMDAVQGFVKGDSLISPGSVLGVLAALKQFETSKQSKSKEETRNSLKAPHQGVIGVSETHHSVNDGKDHARESHVRKESERDTRKGQTDHANRQGVEDQTLSHPQIPSRSMSSRNGIKGTLGVISSLFGHNEPSGGSVLGSLMTNLAPILLSGARTKNDRQMEGGGDVSKPNPLQALLGGIGPLLLGGFGGLGGPRRGPDTPNDIGKVNTLQNIMSQVGSSIMAESALHPNSPIPMQSLLANLGPVLLSSFTQGDNQSNGEKGTANSSPVQAILGGLVPALMAGVMQQGSHTNNMNINNPSPQSPIQSIVNGMGQMMLKKQTGLDGFLADVAPVLMSGAARRGSRTLQGTEVDAEAGYDYNSVVSSGGREVSEAAVTIVNILVEYCGGEATCQ